MNTIVEREGLEVSGSSEAAPALQIAGLQAWYGESHILHGVDLTVNRGEVVTLLGRNGAGRTTTLRAIMGLTGRRTGSIRIGGRETIDCPRIASRTAGSVIARKSAAFFRACRARRTCYCRRPSATRRT
jgi:ABC-type branched-subunit amino acid transport system ATPase component